MYMYLKLVIVYKPVIHVHVQVTRDVPGIDDAYLAMDTEEGVEVVWNEVIYSQSSRKGRGSKERLKTILQGLTSVKVTEREREREKIFFSFKAPKYCQFL